MLRRILGSLALVVASTSLAGAQTPASFHFTNGSGFNSYHGYFNSGADAAELVAGGFTNGSSFQVWCVDEQHTVSRGDNYNVNVTRLSSSDLSSTRVGNQSTYLKAAYLADGMGSNNINQSQYAIWAIVHGKSLKNYCSDILNGAWVSPCDYSVQTLVTNAGANFGEMNPWEWYVITDQTPDSMVCTKLKHGVCKQWSETKGKQELIARCQNECSDPDFPNETENPTPEPATMTLLAMGLAGMAGSSLRRRRR